MRNQHTVAARLRGRARDTNPLIASPVLRIASIALGFVNSVILVRAVLASGGGALYAGISIIASVAGMLPFADFGVGYAVVNDAADLRSGALDVGEFRSRLVGTRDVLILIGVLLVALGAFVQFYNVAHLVLGRAYVSRQLSLALAVNVAAIGITLPLGLGARVLQGLGRLVFVNLAALLTPIVSIAIIVGNEISAKSLVVYAVSTQAGLLVSALVTFLVAVRQTGGGLEAPFARLRTLGLGWSAIKTIGLSALLVNVGLVVAFQTDRIVLGHQSSATEVAIYSIVAQVYAAVFSVVTAASQNLWSDFRVGMARGTLTSRDLFHNVRIFLAAGAVGAVALAVGTRLFTFLASGHRINVSAAPVVAASVLLVLMSAHQPGAMAATSPRAMRVQALLVVLMAACNLGLSIPLAHRFGATGPYVASVLSVLMVQFLPVLWLGRSEILRSQRSHQFPSAQRSVGV